MDENGVHLQIDIPSTDILTLKNDNSFIRIEKERVENIDETDFLSQTKDFSHLTFFHPGDFDPIETSDTSLSSENELESLKPESSDTLSVPPLREISNVFIQAPLETATAFQDASTLSSGNGNEYLNATIPFLQDNVMNASSLSNSSFSEWSAEEIGAIFIVGLMVPFIICSNLFVIVSVIRFRRLHTPTNYFITSLAAVDIVVALATPLAIAVQLFQYGGGDAAHDTVLCLLPNRILMMACGVSLLTLATIAYDRHTALISPLEYVNIMTSRKVGIMMTVSWLYSSAVVWFPIAAGWYDVMSPTVRCSADHLHPKVHILFFVAVFVPSCTVIIICYSRIFLVARHHAKAIAAVEFAVHRRLQVRFMIKDTKYAKTLALVIGGFLLLWLPHLIYTFIKTFGEVSISIWVETYLILLAVFNSGINPWIYAFKNNEFRAAFKRMAKEYCSDKFCKIDDRRSSLVSGMSITPRLSRTDSRMVSTILEPTTDSHGNEKIRRSLDSLDDYEIEVEKTKYNLSESEINERNLTDKCDSSPKFILVKEVAPIDNKEGHVNWGHTDNETVTSPSDAKKTELFRKNSGTTVTRNQSFTQGFNNACSCREVQKDFNEQLCNCRNSSSFAAHKLARSSSSVSPSSFIPYPTNRRIGGTMTPSPLNLHISRLSSPSSPSGSPRLPLQSPFAPLPSSSPSSHSVSSNRTLSSRELLAHKTRPRPARGLCNQVHDSLGPECIPTAGNPVLNDNSYGRPLASNFLQANHEQQRTETNNIYYPCVDPTNSCTCAVSSCLTQVQSCPTFGQTVAAMTNFRRPADRPVDIVCSPVGQMGQTSTSGLLRLSS